MSRSERRARYLEDLTSPEAARLGPTSVLVVPLGSTEQHGPHLPVSTDTDLARELCRRLAQERVDVVVAPPIAYGASGEHQGFAGTISIGREALGVLLFELCKSALDSFARVLIVSTHGGNAETVRSVEEQLHDEGRNVLVWMPRLSGDAHAGRIETSLQLAMTPGRVRHEEIEPGNETPLVELMPIIREQSVRAVSENGILGDPRQASAREGQGLLAALVADLVQTLDHWPRSDSTGQVAVAVR